MKNKIILLTINAKQNLYGVTADEYSAIQPNIYMGLLSAYIKSQGIAVDMIDETKSYSILDIISIIQKEQPLMIGVVCSGANPSSSTMSMVGAIEFFKTFNPQKGTIKTFICGGHPTVMAPRTLEETKSDFVILGEGYETIINLFNSLKSKVDVKNIPRADFNSQLEGTSCYQNNRVIRNTAVPSLINVNKLSMIDWGIMNPSKYRAHNWHCFEDIEHRSPYGVIWTSFGCPYKCSFCCINNLFGKASYRLRDIKSVVEEIDVLVKKYNVKNIKVLDELFIIKNKRIDEFCEALEARNYDLNIWAYARMDTVNYPLLKRLRNVGVKWVAYGMESVSQNILADVEKGYNKKFYDDVIKMTKDAGIYICADFIAGLWKDDYTTLQETYDFAIKHNFEWLNLYPAFAYPGTKMYGNYIRDGKIKEPETWEEYALYGYKCKPVPTEYLTSKEVLKWRDDKFISYIKRPEYLQMLEQKFGLDTRLHIEKMANEPLKRRILE